MPYYCHECGVFNGTIRPVEPAKLTDNSYKLEKYLKHTVPTSLSSYNTVFTSPASETYRDFVVAAVASGHVEVDVKNRVNLVWVASRHTGIALEGGRFVGTTDAVKVVLHHDSAAIHAFPIKASDLKPTRCASCGKTVPY